MAKKCTKKRDSHGEFSFAYLKLWNVFTWCHGDHPLNGVARSQPASKAVGEKEGKKGGQSPSSPTQPTYRLSISLFQAPREWGKGSKKKGRNTACRPGREGRSLSFTAPALLLFSKLRMFWSKLCKSNWICVWNLAFPVSISPIVWNMCENLHYESVYFKE